MSDECDPATRTIPDDGWSDWGKSYTADELDWARDPECLICTMLPFGACDFHNRAASWALVPRCSG